MTNSTNNTITFQARWNQSNQHLSETFFDKVKKIVLFIPNFIISRAILPAQFANKFNWNPDLFEGSGVLSYSLNQYFSETPLEIITPDGDKLQGAYIKSRSAQENAPTVILFQPNATLQNSGCFNWLLRQAALQEFPYNFIYFNYRNCGKSEGSASSEKKLQLDGDSIYQFVKDKLHVPAGDIHFYGWSLGGGIAANVKAIHQEREGRGAFERTYSVIGHVAYNYVFSLLATIVNKFLSFMNWNIDSASAMQKLKGKSLIVHHPEDEMMKKEASLYNALFQRGFPQNCEALDLSRSIRRPTFVHGAPLYEYKTDQFDPEAEVAKFIFDSNCSFEERLNARFEVAPTHFRNQVFAKIATMYQRGGNYWGSGEDAFYNRNGLSLTNKQRADAIVEVKILG